MPVGRTPSIPVLLPRHDPAVFLPRNCPLVLEPNGGPLAFGNHGQDVAAVTVGAPTLTITQSGNSVIVSWPYPSYGWTLQQSPDLTTASWSTSGGISNDGMNNFITITQPAGNLFFRLFNP
jgi:hypothetical protein